MLKSGVNINVGGRPRGVSPQKVIDRMKVYDEYRKRIAENAERLSSAQLSLGLGQQFLYHVHTDNRGNRRAAKLITDPKIIKDFLDGKLSGDPKEYYYITTKEPNTSTIDSMLDRTFGKATQPIGTGADGSEPFRVIIQNFASKPAQIPQNEPAKYIEDKPNEFVEDNSAKDHA